MKIIENNLDGTWQVYNSENGKSALIVAIQEYDFYTPNRKRYRVDVDYKTVESMIDHFQTAKSVAYSYVD